jgi:hypothetical protein
MRATRLLRKDHRDLRRLFVEKRALAEMDASSRKEALVRLKKALALHLTLEEELFYPTVKERPSAEAVEALQAPLDRHSVVNLLLWELWRMDPSNPRFESLMAELRRAVERHICDDERTLFEEARSHLSGGRMERLGLEMQARKRVAQSPPGE